MILHTVSVPAGHPAERLTPYYWGQRTGVGMVLGLRYFNRLSIHPRTNTQKRCVIHSKKKVGVRQARMLFRLHNHRALFCVECGSTVLRLLGLDEAMEKMDEYHKRLDQYERSQARRSRMVKKPLEGPEQGRTKGKANNSPDLALSAPQDISEGD